MWKKDNHSDESKLSSMESMDSKESRPKPTTRNVGGKTAREIVRPNSQTVISQKSMCSGDINGDSDVLISGNFQGSIVIPKHTVTIDIGGKAKASINAARIIAHGTVVGNLIANELVKIPATGVVEGDIQAANVVLEKGCSFNGSIEMPQDKRRQGKGVQPKDAARAQPRPAPRPTRVTPVSKASVS